MRIASSLYGLSLGESILYMLLLVAVVCISMGVAWLYKKAKRLPQNGWKHAPFPKWRGEVAEVRDYLSEGGLQNIVYSPDEGISGYALSGAKCLDSFAEGGAFHSNYISGIYKAYPVQLSAVRLEQIDEDEAMRAAVRTGMTGIPRYAQSGFYTYFNGTWYLFRVKRKFRGDFYLIDRRLGAEDDRHGPGKHTSLPRLSLGWRLANAFDGYFSDADEGAADRLLTDEVQTLLLKLHEQYHLVIILSGAKVHIGIADKKHLFGHREDETAEDWREQQTLLETLADLTELVSHFGTPPSEDEYFF